jgi:hypothetical protein
MRWPASRKAPFPSAPSKKPALASFVALLGAQPETLAMGSELLVNGVEHGNLGIDFAEKSRLRESDCWEDEIRRRLTLPENRGKAVRMRVRKDDPLGLRDLRRWAGL